MDTCVRFEFATHHVVDNKSRKWIKPWNWNLAPVVSVIFFGSKITWHRYSNIVISKIHAIVPKRILCCTAGNDPSEVPLCRVRNSPVGSFFTALINVNVVTIRSQSEVRCCMQLLVHNLWIGLVCGAWAMLYPCIRRSMFGWGCYAAAQHLSFRFQSLRVLHASRGEYREYWRHAMNTNYVYFCRAKAARVRSCTFSISFFLSRLINVLVSIYTSNKHLKSKNYIIIVREDKIDRCDPSEQSHTVRMLQRTTVPTDRFIRNHTLNSVQWAIIVAAMSLGIAVAFNPPHR